MFVALLACSPTADVVTGPPPACAFGFERREDGACYEIDGDTADPTADDTGAVEGDTDTDADTDADSDADADTDSDTAAPDTGPWDADGDGYYASADCDDTDAALNPGAADDTDDGVDNDCDGDVDEDFDACAVAYGGVEWYSDTVHTDWVGRAGLAFEGTATVCAFSCSVWWASADGIGTSDTCASMEALPYTLSGSSRACITLADPGPESWGSCELETSAGTVTIGLHWQG